jgi:hypothetical protein
MIMGNKLKDGRSGNSRQARQVRTKAFHDARRFISVREAGRYRRYEDDQECYGIT